MLRHLMLLLVISPLLSLGWPERTLTRPSGTLSHQTGKGRGPNLSEVGARLSRRDMVIRIVNGGVNMPAYGNNLTPRQLDELVAFLQSRDKSQSGKPIESALKENSALLGLPHGSQSSAAISLGRPQ
jgi:hypothetical protein